MRRPDTWCWLGIVPDSPTNQPEGKQPVLLLPLLPKICPDSYCWLSPLSPRGQPQEEPGQGLHLPGWAIGVPLPVAVPSHKGASPLNPSLKTPFLSFSSSTGVQTLDSHSFTLQVNNVLMISTPNFGDDISVGLSPRLLQICSNVSLKEKFRALPAEHFCKLLYTI